MKVTVVPAQVTTVEDRIAGNLGLSQILLLVAPIFIGSALYVVLPPNMHNSTYKIVAIVAILLICSTLAIRIKGKILLLWLIVIVSYNLRPRYYLYNKNSILHREEYEPVITLEIEVEDTTTPAIEHRLPALSTIELMHVQSLLENPAANLAFETGKKGGLYVRITEVKEQS